MSRFNGNEARRTIFLHEIESYIVAYMYMKENDIIKELIEFSESQHYSFSPILGQDDSIVRHEEVYDFPDQSPFDINSNYIENVGKLASGAKKDFKIGHFKLLFELLHAHDSIDYFRSRPNRRRV